MVAVITGILILALGTITGVLSLQLAVVGGSLFYIIMAGLLILSGIALIRKSGIAYWLYALLLVLTFIWTIYEVGFDKWLWIPRGVLLLILGIWLALPFVTRAVIRRNGAKVKPAITTLRTVSAILVIAGCIIWFYDPLTYSGALATLDDKPGASDGAGDDWTAYGGSNLGQRYSRLADINVGNVKKLKLAWEHHTGDIRGSNDSAEFTFEVTPLKVNNLLYLCSPRTFIEALDPATGNLKWRFDPKVQGSIVYEHQTCRGVSYYQDPSSSEATASNKPAACKKRIIAATIDARMFALDADTGELCHDFGDNGFVNLTDGQPNQNPKTYMQTSPGLIAQNLIIVGAAIADNYYVDNPSGVIRAYDVHTGKLVWKFDAELPADTKPLQPGETYQPGSPNSWTVFAANDDLGLVYIPLGNKSPDQFGMGRTAKDSLFVDALVALDIKTGQLRWRFQTTYHDLWDRDIPAQPVLIDLPMNGANVPSIIQSTKGGNVWVLDRRNGKPVYRTYEMDVSTTTNIPGEQLSPVQPISSLNFIPPPLTESDMWGATPIDQLLCRIAFNKNRYDGNPYTPPDLHGSIVYPGNLGVFNWGSVAVDPVNKWMIANPMRLAFIYQVYPREDYKQSPDERLVTSGPKPSGENLGGPFAIKLLHFFSPVGIPCQSPPWGLRVGVDLKTGKTVWLQRNGSVEGQKVLGINFPLPLEMGTIGLGGPLVTAGGLAFNAGSMDNVFRAYDIQTGQTLWSTVLPAGGQATPMTYRGADGKQYIVIAAGGHSSLGTPLGDAVLAFTIED